jgi:hypothetical protein
LRWPTTRNNETTLGGLVPGRSNLRQAISLLGESIAAPTWFTCDGDEINLYLNQEKVVQAIRMSRPLTFTKPSIDCFGAALEGRAWKTGRGLRLGDSASHALQLYGEPDSRSPSTKDGRQLELLYYAFDWAGPDVPQILTVLCTLNKGGKPGWVVEITLDASSL